MNGCLGNARKNGSLRLAIDTNRWPLANTQFVSQPKAH
jgi:hypothetical protein